MIGIDIKISIGFDMDCILDELWDKAQNISNDYKGSIAKEDYAHGIYNISFESDNENDIDNMFYDMGSYLNKKRLGYEVQYYEGS